MTSHTTSSKITHGNQMMFTVGGLIMSVAMMVSSWFLNEAWTKIATVENKVQALEITSAADHANKFTVVDWSIAKTTMDTDRLALDRRLIRVEENSTVIKDALIRIESGLKNK